MNKIIINYYSYDINSRLFELMRQINDLDIEVSWDDEKSLIEIAWNAGEEKLVDGLLEKFREVFPAKGITIRTLAKDNDSDDTERIVVIPASCESIDKTDDIASNEDETLKENADVAKSTVVSEKHDVIESGDSKNADSCVEESKTYEKEKVTDEIPENHASEKEETAVVGGSSKESEEVEEKLEEHGSSTEVDISEETSLKQPETKVEVLGTHDEESLNTSTVAETMEDGKRALNMILTETFGEAVFKFLNPSEGSYDERLSRLYDELKINGEAFKKAIFIASSTKSIDKIYDDIARMMRKNATLVKIDIKKSFEKWLKTNYASIAEMYPKIEVKDFLNIFRSESKKD